MATSSFCQTTVIVPPSGVVVKPSAIKQNLRIADATDDDRILSWIQAAQELVTADTGVALLAQTWRLTLDRMGYGCHLPGAPVTGITRIFWITDDGVEHVVPESDYHLVKGIVPAEIRARPGIGAFSGLDSNTRRFSAYVDYTLGYATADQVPAGIIEAIHALVAAWYDHRDGLMPGMAKTMPMAAQSALARYRQPRVS